MSRESTDFRLPAHALCLTSGASKEMLKRKKEINYRKAVTTRDGRFNRCKNCALRMLVDILGCDGKFIKKDWRCEPIGLGNSRRYACEGDHVCDHVAVVARQPEV